jgi:hypothetical protein
LVLALAINRFDISFGNQQVQYSSVGLLWAILKRLKNGVILGFHFSLRNEQLALAMN